MSASGRFNIKSFLLRFFIALILVFATYNPSTYSYFHWVKNFMNEDTQAFPALMAFVGVILLIGWVMYIRATWNSLGPLGLFLAAAFFGALIWVIIDWGLLPLNSQTVIIYIVEVILVGVLATGMSWSHIRRRMSGQLDTDEIEG